MHGYTNELPPMELERRIRQTMDLYAHAMDYGDEKVWCDCFTEDALFLVTDVQKQEEIYRVQGARQLAAYIGAYPKPPAVHAKHICTQILIQVDGNQASAQSFWLAVNSHGGASRTEPNIMAFGRYRDRLVACPDGCWRFTERICETESAHWREPGTYTDRENFPGD